MFRRYFVDNLEKDSSNCFAQKAVKINLKIMYGQSVQKNTYNETQRRFKNSTFRFLSFILLLSFFIFWIFVWLLMYKRICK